MEQSPWVAVGFIFAAHHHPARLQPVDNDGDGAMGEADLGTELLQTQALGLYQGLHHHALRPGKTAAQAAKWKRGMLELQGRKSEAK
jgi:hypothetical protein